MHDDLLWGVGDDHHLWSTDVGDVGDDAWQQLDDNIWRSMSWDSEGTMWCVGWDTLTIFRYCDADPQEWTTTQWRAISIHQDEYWGLGKDEYLWVCQPEFTSCMMAEEKHYYDLALIMPLQLQLSSHPTEDVPSSFMV